jgi:hypothetical protein
VGKVANNLLYLTMNVKSPLPTTDNIKYCNNCLTRCRFYELRWLRVAALADNLTFLPDCFPNFAHPTSIFSIRYKLNFSKLNEFFCLKFSLVSVIQDIYAG